MRILLEGQTLCPPNRVILQNQNVWGQNIHGKILLLPTGPTPSISIEVFVCFIISFHLMY